MSNIAFLNRLKELQKYTGNGGVLSNMQEMKAARLSVSKVSEEEWDFIVNQLIDGYEDDAALPQATNGEAAVDEDAELPNGITVTETTEVAGSDLPTSDTMLAAETAATSSRPASRAGSAANSRPGSRAGSVKKSTSRAASRAGSLVPPSRAGSRARSRTPGGRASSAQPMATVSEELEVFEG